MKHTNLQKAIDRITDDVSKTLDERIEAVINLDPDNEAGYEGEIAIYSSLIGMLWRESRDHIHDTTLLQLYVLLAEAYDEQNDYRPMKEVADGVLRLLCEGNIPTEELPFTVVRLVDVLKYSVYYHSLYELLFVYVKRMLDYNPDDTSVKSSAKTLLTLKILLPQNERYDMKWTKDFEEALSRLFTAEELIRIIAEPRLGHLKSDPIEFTREWERIYYDVEAEVNRRFEGIPRQMGLCFRIWSVKKEILKNKYGIDWSSPGEMNPRVIFD